MPFGTVTCDLNTGKELWVTEGPVFDAVWPSMAMPGVFQPVLNKRKPLVYRRRNCQSGPRFFVPCFGCGCGHRR